MSPDATLTGELYEHDHGAWFSLGRKSRRLFVLRGAVLESRPISSAAADDVDGNGTVRISLQGAHLSSTGQSMTLTGPHVPNGTMHLSSPSTRSHAQWVRALTRQLALCGGTSTQEEPSALATIAGHRRKSLSAAQLRPQRAGSPGAVSPAPGDLRRRASWHGASGSADLTPTRDEMGPSAGRTSPLLSPPTRHMGQPPVMHDKRPSPRRLSAPMSALQLPPRAPGPRGGSPNGGPPGAPADDRAQIVEIRKEASELMGLGWEDHTRLHYVLDGSPAERCGCKRLVGWRVTHANGKAVSRVRHLKRAGDNSVRVLLRFVPPPGSPGSPATGITGAVSGQLQHTYTIDIPEVPVDSEVSFVTAKGGSVRVGGPQPDGDGPPTLSVSYQGELDPPCASVRVAVQLGRVELLLGEEKPFRLDPSTCTRVLGEIRALAKQHGVPADIPERLELPLPGLNPSAGAPPSPASEDGRGVWPRQPAEPPSAHAGRACATAATVIVAVSSGEESDMPPLRARKLSFKGGRPEQLQDSRPQQGSPTRGSPQGRSPGGGSPVGGSPLPRSPASVAASPLREAVRESVFGGGSTGRGSPTKHGSPVHRPAGGRRSPLSLQVHQTGTSPRLCSATSPLLTGAVSQIGDATDSSAYEVSTQSRTTGPSGAAVSDEHTADMTTCGEQTEAESPTATEMRGAGESSIRSTWSAPAAKKPALHAAAAAAPAARGPAVASDSQGSSGGHAEPASGPLPTPGEPPRTDPSEEDPRVTPPRGGTPHEDNVTDAPTMPQGVQRSCDSTDFVEGSPPHSRLSRQRTGELGLQRAGRPSDGSPRERRADSGKGSPEGSPDSPEPGRAASPAARAAAAAVQQPCREEDRGAPD